MSNNLEEISNAMQKGNSGKDMGIAGNTTTQAATAQGKQDPTARSIPLNRNIRKPNQPCLSTFASEQEKIKNRFGAGNNLEEEESSNEKEEGNKARMEASNETTELFITKAMAEDKAGDRKGAEMYFAMQKAEKKAEGGNKQKHQPRPIFGGGRQRQGAHLAGQPTLGIGRRVQAWQCL
ncbi:hypothetical protein PCANC_23485 [Puccinia coronata f. sp. avenae]|uniref:Uncharacterized protein n=1 Tax=Puccinia coronata f. sp. avenae TaxID=200324 RepID=A0A2N5TT65_9BASI|nr:hypothetical protein PCANC_23485 [Puccinia coronata f. sp. avenae]